MRTWTRNHPTFSIRDWSDGKDKNKTKHNFCIHMFTLRQHAYAFTSAINGYIILIDMLFYSHLEIQQVNTQDIRDEITFL